MSQTDQRASFTRPARLVPALLERKASQVTTVSEGAFRLHFAGFLFCALQGEGSNLKLWRIWLRFALQMAV